MCSHFHIGSRPRTCPFLLPVRLHVPPFLASHHDGQGVHDLLPPVPLRQREHPGPCMPDTGYEPNVMELTGTTELNDAASSDINFQDSLDYTAPSSDLYIDDDELGKLLEEVHRDCAHYRRAEGVNVSPSSVSVMVDRTGELVERSDSEHFPCSVRNVKVVQNQFLVITQAKRMVDRTGELVEERIAEERESCSAQVRTLLNEQRKTIIAEYCEKVFHHELLAAQAEQERKILQGTLLRQQQDFREVHQQDLFIDEGISKFPKFYIR